MSDELLAGLVHALNNRITALSVCLELAGLGDVDMLAGGVLHTEAARLQRAAALVGLLPARGLPEALEIGPVLGDAIAIHAHHPRARDVECVTETLGTLQPIRVPRWALLRALLLMVDAAKASASRGERRTVTIGLASDERTVRVHAPAVEHGGVYALEMASMCGGSLSHEGGELVLTLPSLLEVRRRERTEMAGG